MEQEIGNSGALSSNKAALLTELLTQKLLALDNVETQVHSMATPSLQGLFYHDEEMQPEYEIQ